MRSDAFRTPCERVPERLHFGWSRGIGVQDGFYFHFKDKALSRGNRLLLEFGRQSLIHSGQSQPPAACI